MVIRRLARAAVVFAGCVLSAQTRDGFVPVPGARLFFRDFGGSGAPVIFVHAGSGNTDMWEKQVPAFTAAGYRVITYDRRGWGRSIDEPGYDQSWTATRDLVALVNHLRLGRSHLVGTALGGFVVFDFALSHPELLRSAVIASSVGGFDDEELIALNQRLRPKGLMEMPPEFYELGPEYRASDPGGVKRWLEHEMNSRHSPESKTPLDHRLRLALLEKIEVPMLLLTGGADLIAPPTLQKMFATRLKHAEQLVIANTGHSVFWEAPDLFNRSVLLFLEKH